MELETRRRPRCGNPAILSTGSVFARQCAAPHRHFQWKLSVRDSLSFGHHLPYLRNTRSLSWCSCDLQLSGTFELRIRSVTPPGSTWGCIMRLWLSWIQKEALLWQRYVTLRYLQKPNNPSSQSVLSLLHASWHLFSLFTACSDWLVLYRSCFGKRLLVSSLSSVFLSALQSVRRTSLLVKTGSASQTSGCAIGSTTVETGATKGNAVSFATSKSALGGLTLI